MAHDNALCRLATPGGIFLLLLLSADLAFVAVHLVHTLTPKLSEELYSLKTDRGYAEVFQYVKTAWIVVLLAGLGWCTRQRVYFAWMLLYAYLLADDALKVHERIGTRISRDWDVGSAIGLRPRDFGEMSVYAAAGFTLVTLIVIAYLRSSRDPRNASQDLGVLFCVLVFFGLFVDMLDIIAGGTRAEVIVGLIEDGGEMFAMSLVCWYAFHLSERRGNMPTALWQRTRSAWRRG